MRTFTRKGYGRIYVLHEEHIQEVHRQIHLLDSYEYSYMANTMVTTFDKFPEVVHTGKFDALDLDALTSVCWAQHIPIWCYDSGHEDHPSKPALTATRPGLEAELESLVSGRCTGCTTPITCAISLAVGAQRKCSTR